MTLPIEEGRDREEVGSLERADVRTKSGDGWSDLEARLAPLEALVPEEAPPWRAAALGVVAVLGVFAASMVALLGVVSLEHLLLPEADAADLTHGLALGIAVAAWGALSLGVLAAAARAILGRAAVLRRRDVFVAGILFLLLAGWTAGLQAWVVGVAGYVELDLIARSTYVWPLVVVLAAVALAGARFTRGAVTVGVLVLVAVALLAITIETIRNAFGAIADGEVSRAGVLVGVLSVAQIAVLGVWFASTVRNRYWR